MKLTLGAIVALLSGWAIVWQMGMTPVVAKTFDAHLEEYAETKAEMLYYRCVRLCEETCERQSPTIRADDCNCEHCKRHLEGE